MIGKQTRTHHAEPVTSKGDERQGSPGKTSLVQSTFGAPAGPGAAGPGRAGAADRFPYQAELERLFGEDFSDVEVRLGTGGAGDAALASHEGARDVVTFDSAAPSREQVAHELTHVVQRRRFGAGRAGHSRMADDSEREARELGARAAAGEVVDVRAAPAARMQRDGDVAQNIHDKLHALIDDEDGAVADLRGDRDRRATCARYRARYGVDLWSDFIANASGATLRQALALLWPHMTVLDRLSTMIGIDDDEDGILQTIQSASDAELRAARGGIQPYLDELDPADGYSARQRIWPERAVENVVWLLHAGDGWIWDDEGPAASAILGLTPAQRLELWTRHQDAFGMFNERDRAQIGRMCQGPGGAPATDADAARVRMELATDGLGTDEDGVRTAIATAGNRRDELERIRTALASGRGDGGQPLTEAQRRVLERRLDELGDVGALLTPTAGDGGRLDERSFLGRVQADMDAATVDAALTTAHADAFTRAKQALLLTLGDTGIDVDEEAALQILRDVRGDLELAPGETFDGLGEAEVTRRRAASTARLRQALRRDPDLRPVWAALDAEELAYANDLTAGDTYASAIRELTEAFEGIDTDEAAILRILRELDPATRETLRDRNPAILHRIRDWPLGDAFRRAFEAVLATGHIPTGVALDAAFGGWGDGTDEDMATDALARMSVAERARHRRGYLLAHTHDEGADRTCRAPLPAEDQEALDAYRSLHARMASELTPEELDAALQALLGLPTVAEMQTERGRIDAATIMLMRQRERLQLTAGDTDAFTTTDDTAAAAHAEFSGRYDRAMEDGAINETELAVLIHLDEQFASRFREYSETANLVSEIAGTVAAVVAAAVVIIASGGTATAATPGVVAWLSANSTLISASAATGALAQVGASEAMGGDFNDALGPDGARQALSGALNGALAICGAALAERAATLVGLSGRALTAQIARSAVGATETSVGGRAFARGALTGLIDGSLSGAVGELAMTLTDAETWRRSVWQVLARAGAALLRGGVLGGATGAASSGLLESAQGLLRARALRDVAVHLDDGLGTGAHLEFQINADGSLDGLALHFGPGTTDGDLAAHVERVVAVRRASAVLSRARELTTQAGHARQEVLKIDRMIQDRLRQLRAPLSPQTRAVVEAELDVLQANLDEFADVAARGELAQGSGHIGRPDAPPGYPEPPTGHYYRRRGDGWDLQRYPDAEASTPRFTLESDGRGGWRTVSRESVAAAPAARFPEGTTAEQAFEQLVGPDSRSSFKAYWEMLRDRGLATREEVLAAMLDPAGRTEDAVRHALKEAFEGRVIARTLRGADGAVLSEAESMLQLRELTANLNPSDRGNLTEAWYLARHDGLVPHPTMTREANPGVVGREGRGVRNPDFIDGQTLVEVKSTRLGLSREEVQQIGDDLLVCASQGSVTLEDGSTRAVRSVRLVFSDVRGARGAADQLAAWLAGHPALTVEVFGATGAATRITATNLAELQARHEVTSLRALLGVL